MMGKCTWELNSQCRVLEVILYFAAKNYRTVLHSVGVDSLALFVQQLWAL